MPKIKEIRTIISWRGLGRLFTLFAVIIAIILLASCSEEDPIEKSQKRLKSFPEADMSGYSGLADYEQETKFADLSVHDVIELMDDGETFVLYTGFDACPWCNALIKYLNDVAVEKTLVLAYIDTRKDPAWDNNTDIEGYDKFVERFGEFLPEDDDGLPHLYVPDIFFIKDGEVVSYYDGVLPSLENPNDDMTEEQEEELRNRLRDAFEVIE